MIIFGFLTIRNVKLSRQRINQVVQINREISQNRPIGSSGIKSREYELLRIIVVQLIVYLITCLPFAAYLIFSTVVSLDVQSAVQLATNKFFGSLSYALANINFSATFYIYVLTARVLRKDLKRLLTENRFYIYFFGT